MKKSIRDNQIEIETVQDSFPLCLANACQTRNEDSIPSDTISFHDFVISELQKALPPRVQHPSIFFSGTHTPKSFVEKPFVSATHGGWIFWLLLSLLVWTAWLYGRFYKRMRQICLGCWSNHSLNQVMRDGNIIRENIFIPTVFLYILVLGLLLNECLNAASPQGIISNNNFLQYLVVMLSFGIFVLVKNLFTKLIGTLFRTNTSYYISSTWSFNLIIALILALLSPLYFYADINKVVIGSIIAAICVILYAIRLFRGFVVAMNYSKFSRLYLFLYLCTVEILPVLLVFKYLTSL